MLAMKLLFGTLFLILFSVIASNPESQQLKPYYQTIKQKSDQTKEDKNISDTQKSNSANTLSLQATSPTPELKKTTNNKGTYSQDNSYKKWRDIKNSPVDVFTGIIAIFTILLVTAGFYQVFIARVATRKQLRAYVFIDTIDVVNIIAPPPETILPPGSWIYQSALGPLAFIAIKNSGQTPAYGVLNWGEICFREFPLTSVLPYGDRNALSLIRTKLAIPPGGKTIKNIRIPQPLSDDEIAKLRAGTHAIYVYGDIVYKDIFGKKRFTNFRYFINGITGFTHQANAMSGCEEGNEAN